MSATAKITRPVLRYHGGKFSQTQGHEDFNAPTQVTYYRPKSKQPKPRKRKKAKKIRRRDAAKIQKKK